MNASPFQRCGVWWRGEGRIHYRPQTSLVIDYDSNKLHSDEVPAYVKQENVNAELVGIEPPAIGIA